MEPETLAREFERLRPELTAHLARIVVRAAVAEELAQETALRALRAIGEAPTSVEGLRPWLYRIATNLGIDERRRHGSWRETTMIEARAAAGASPAFTAATASLRGSPEMKAVAREHLVACFACTLGQLPPEQAAALLLKEVAGFTVDEAADLLESRPAQVKNRLQAARAAMTAKYETSCALLGKQGVCYQCAELDGFFRAGAGDPLGGTEGRIDDRLAIVRAMRAEPASRWMRLLSDVLAEIG